MEDVSDTELSSGAKFVGFLLFVSFVSLLIIVGIKLYRKSNDNNNCTTPDPVTTGYDLSGATETLDKDNFSVTGVRCASDYTGTPSATACSVAGEPYTLTGCSSSIVSRDDPEINDPEIDDPEIDVSSSCSLSSIELPYNGNWGTTCSQGSRTDE